MASLYDRISKGTISVDEITASMERSTSAGGKYFQSMDKQSQTLNGQLSTLSDNFNNFVGNALEPINQMLAEKILPALNNFLQEASEGINNINFDNLLENLNKLLSTIESIGIAFLSWKVGMTIQTVIQAFQKAQIALSLYSLSTNGASVAQGLFNGTLTISEGLVALLTGKITLAQIATGLWQKAQIALNAAMSANPIGLIITLIGLLVAAIVYLWNTNEGFRNTVIKIWEKIKETIVNVVDSIIKFFTETVPNAFESFIDFWMELGENIKNIFTDAWNAVVSFFTETIPQWIQNVITWFQELPYKLGYALGQMIANIVKFGINTRNWVTTELPKIIQSIIDWFKQLPDRIWEWLQNTINNIMTWGQEMWNNATTWTSNTINSIIEWFKQLPGKIWTWLTNTINNIINWGKDLANKGKEAAQNLFINIVDTIKNLPNKMLEIGKNIVQGIWNGITGMGTWLKNKISSFASGIIDGFKDTLGIHSPSTVMAYWSKFVPEGVAVGIDANTDTAVKAIDDMNNEIEKKMKNAVYTEMGKINTNATVKANNSMLNVTTINSTIEGKVELEGKTTGRLLAPFVTQTYRKAGVN